jgi:hypothetical protein
MAKVTSMRNAMRACNALAALAMSFGVLAQDTKPAPCSAPEHRQFDFWIGEWEVKGPAGKVAGQNSITSIHNGCVLFENWKGAGGMTGSSFNVYDPERKKWRQTWVDSNGGTLDLEGEFAEGKMVLASKPASKTDAINRITWEKLPDGRVRQLWQVSSEAGATWKTAFDGYYGKR